MTTNPAPTRRVRLAALAVVAIVATGCAGGDRPQLVTTEAVPTSQYEGQILDPTIREATPVPTTGELSPPPPADGAGSTDEGTTDTTDTRRQVPERNETTGDATAPAPSPSAEPSPELSVEPTATAAPTATPEPTPTATAPPTPTPQPTSETATGIAAPNGRSAPLVATTPAELARQIIDAETGVRNPNATDAERAAHGHAAQVAYRKLGYEPSWDSDVLGAMPDDLLPIVELHLRARRSLGELHSGFDAADFIPAWSIEDPEPASALRSYYEEAEAATGIEWEYLAAINLVETGMGRIRGLSGAGAQGPMQFIPTTWDEVGEGDVNDPRDAIQAAARYLVRRGGPEDMQGALWGYNNSDLYVDAVSAYAEMVRLDAAAFDSFYNWEIYFATDAGDVWLPVGYQSTETVDLAEYLAAAPWSQPDPNLS